RCGLRESLASAGERCILARVNGHASYRSGEDRSKRTAMSRMVSVLVGGALCFCAPAVNPLNAQPAGAAEAGPSLETSTQPAIGSDATPTQAQEVGAPHEMSRGPRHFEHHSRAHFQ